MNELTTLEKINANLQLFGSYGYMVLNVKYPYFYTVLYFDGENYCWSHAGSSANEANIENLEWIITKIFGITPDVFVKRYEVRYNELYYMDELRYA